jgi:hypothetical protein
VLAEFDIGNLLWLVIIVGSIIAQLFKGVRKHNENAPGAPRIPSEGEERPQAQELEEFLRTLLGDQPPKPAPPPQRVARPAMPTPTRPPVVSRPAQRVATPVRPQMRPAVTPVTRPQAPVEPPRPLVRQQAPAPRPRPAVPPVPVREVSIGDVIAAATGSMMHVGISDEARRREVAELRVNLFRQLKSPQGLRSAVFLREVLGPPIALQGMRKATHLSG